MNYSSMILARNLIADVRAHGEIVAQGLAALAVVQNAIRLLSEASGFHLEFDPSSDPTLVDHLAVTGCRMLETGLLGGTFGLLLGALLDRPLEGALLGAGVGAAVGAAQGVDQVARGWRLRATWQPDGSPLIVIRER